MIEISRHIEILLLDNDCVIVPGLGGFMTHYTPAQIVEDEGILYPPYRSIGFNPQLYLNDSLLAQSYVEAYDMSYPEAVKRISGEVEEIKQQLDIEGEYEFRGIGTLKQVSEGRYDFQPSVSGLVTPSLYALNGFELSEIEHTVPMIDVAITPLNKVKMMDFTSLKTAAMVAVMLFLFILSSIPAGTGSGPVQQCSVVNTEALTKLIKQGKPDIQLTNQQDTVAVEAPQTINDETVVQSHETVKPHREHYYVLVVAARVSKSGAKNLVSKLKKCGFVDTNICERTSNRKVIYGHYKSADEALDALHTLRSQEISFTDAWISRI